MYNLISNQSNIVSYALSKSGSIVDLICHTIIDNEIEIFNECMELDFNVNGFSTKFNKTLLMCATEYVRPLMLESLFRRGALIEQSRSTGLLYEAFDKCSHVDSFACIKILIKAGATIESLTYNTKYYRIAEFIKKSIEKIECPHNEKIELPKQSHIHKLSNVKSIIFDNTCQKSSTKSNDDGTDTLTTSNQLCIKEMYQLIVDDKIDAFCTFVDIVPNLNEPYLISDSTLIMHAVQFGRIKILQILLDNGASVADDHRGKSPLYFAFITHTSYIPEEQFECAKLLIKAGSNIELLAQYSEQSYHLAKLIKMTLEEYPMIC